MFFLIIFFILPFNDCQDVGLFVNSWTHETVFLFSEQSIKLANALLDTKHKSIRKKKSQGHTTVIILKLYSEMNCVFF